MLNKTLVYFFLILPFWFVFQKGSDFNEKKEIKHTIVVEHPGEKTPIELILIEVQDKTGLPIEYYAHVESVICLQDVCKVVSVKIYWNNVGVYQHYELEEGDTLEKYEADFFEPEDYKKLHSILSNFESPYKEVRLDEVLTVVDETMEDVDAVSGATALELDEKDTVDGAALTCFTLWHWANGDLISLIKNNTAETVSNEHLLGFLNDESETHYLLTLEQLQKRKIYSKVFIDAILDRVFKDKTLIRTSLKYIQTAPQEVYFSSIKRLIIGGEKEQRISALKSLQNSHYSADKFYLDDISNDLKLLNSFQEVSAFLELMQNKNPNSKIVVDCLIPLLNEDFLIARRVYYFLINQQLTSKEKLQIDAFHTKHKNQL